MTSEPPRAGEEEPEPTDFDWASPRWREQEAGTDADQRRRRFRDESAPSQRGAIDAHDSIPGKRADASPTEPDAAD